MISLFMGSSPASGSILTAWSLEPASDSVSLSLSSPPLLVLAQSINLSLSLSLSLSLLLSPPPHEARHPLPSSSRTVATVPPAECASRAADLPSVSLLRPHVNVLREIFLLLFYNKIRNHKYIYGSIP